MRPVRTILAVALAAASALPLHAQEKRALQHSDYDVWNRIQNDVLSRNGRWLAYQLTPGDGDGVLMIRALQGEGVTRIPRGVSPVLTSDSRWLVARIAPMDSVVERGKREKKKPADQPKDSLVILDLQASEASGAFRAADVKSFKVPEDGSGWVAYLLEKKPAGRKEAGGQGAEAGPEKADSVKKAPRTPDGATLVVRSLASGNERRFEHVVDYAFAKDGSVLYFTASGEDGSADGVFRVRPSGDAETVSTGEGRYLKLAVSDDGAHVAFVSDRDDRSAEAPAFSLFVGGASDEASAVVTPEAQGVPSGWAPSQNGTVSFSDGGGRVFFGTAARPQPEPEDDTPADEKVSVDVWNWKDPYLQPMQKIQAEQEKKRTFEAVYDVASGRTVQLATEDVPTITVADKGDGSVALGVSDLPYRQLISWDGRYVDAYLVDPADGSHRKVAEKIKGFPRLSPGGGYAYWWDGEARAWKAVDTRTGETHNLTGAIDEAFYDELDDHPDLPPSYGSAGWTEGDASFLVYDAYDIWAVDPTGRRAPRNVTDGVGRASHLRLRYADTGGGSGFGFGFGRGGPDEAIPADQDVFLSAFDTETKASGYYRDRFDGNRRPQQLVMGDYSYRGLTKAEDADVYVFNRESFQDFPDLWKTDAGFRSPARVTDANPQQAQYLWGSDELVHWISDDGMPLDGILVKPEGFDPAKQYPMMVYFYERMSDRLHAYQAPAAGSSSINFSFYASRGYLVFIPDIPYEIGHPGESAVDAVVPGVLSLVEKGFVDRERIGVQGHSWGGYQIAYMVTKTNLFRAAEAGAPVANMTSAYGGIRWGTGMSRAFQYERTQSRIGGSLWEKPLLYIENSPLFSADKIQTPLLMMHNDEDTAVPWYQGIEFFSALRRLHKPVWMMVYNGEPHGLRKEQNRKDWAIRMQQFFDHYLKDAPAPVWLAEGVPAVLKGKTLGLELETKTTISQGGSGGSR